MTKRAGMRVYKTSKQKVEFRRHQRKRLEKLARRGIKTKTSMNKW